MQKTNKRANVYHLLFVCFGGLLKNYKQKQPKQKILKNQLTIKEYRICLLIRLKFSPTIIGNIVGLSNSGVSLSRKRMLEKVCGKDGTPKDFDKFILSLV